MHIHQIERRDEAAIDRAPIRVDGESNSFAVACSQDCLLIGTISLLSQSKSNECGEHNLTIQQGTHSAPCSFNDSVEVFRLDSSKLRLTEITIAEFDENQFAIPRTDRPGFTVEVNVDLPRVDIDVSGPVGGHNQELLHLIAREAVTAPGTGRRGALKIGGQPHG
jgi:hypothetical protein